MKIFAISDLHTDFAHNWNLIVELPDLYQQDVLIVAGDIADKLTRVRDSLSVLRSKFARVFYLPGNHEFWVSHNGTDNTDKPDSLEKFLQLRSICDQIDVDTRPARIADVWIVPLLSWYEANFDQAGESLPYIDDEKLWADHYRCLWPAQIANTAQYFADLNRAHIKTYDAPVISFSHFLPRRELLPPIDFLYFKALLRVAGSVLIEEQLRAINSKIHVFGHSHINRDSIIDGVRYIQNALGYPRERVNNSLPIKPIWQTNRA